jgi:hypothetical protein
MNFGRTTHQNEETDDSHLHFRKLNDLHHLSRFLNVALIIGLCAFAVFAQGFSLSEKKHSGPSLIPPTTVPANFFGLTINHIESTPWPTIPFASIRTWDTIVSWGAINIAEGSYAWQQLDRLIYLAERNGVDVVFTLGLTPRWASSKPDAPNPYGPGLCAPPRELKFWDEFVQAVVTHARGKIKFWEVWNEPQDITFYCGDVATMAELQRHAYRIIKRIDPAAMVLTPSPVGKAGLKWMSEFLATGAGDYADIMAFHGYWDTTAETIKSVIEQYKAVFIAAGQELKPFWDTEASWGENAQLSEPDAQAAFVAKYYLLQWSGGVSRFYWYSYDNNTYGGLWDPEKGLHDAGVAYRAVHDWMVGSYFIEPCNEERPHSNIWTCSLRRPNGEIAKVVWCTSGRSAYYPDHQFRQYHDLDGTRWSISGEIRIDRKPILLEP